MCIRDSVTPEDYEQLFLDRIENLESCSVEFDKGFYRIRASVSTRNPSITSENIKEELFVIYHENRNLCEDLRWDDIHILTKAAGKRQKRTEDTPQIESTHNLDHSDAVTYTHLDVYKRQGLHRRRHHRFAKKHAQQSGHRGSITPIRSGFFS